MVALAQPLAARPASLARTAKRRQAASQRGSVRVTAFAVQRLDLAEGPGSGLRHYPDPKHGQFEPRAAPSEAPRHDMMSTEACYRMFPLVTHCSTPLHIEDSEPAGMTVVRTEDAGPATGQRRRPGPTDGAAGQQHQVLPATHPTDLRRELMARHAPEVLLAQQRRTDA